MGETAAQRRYVLRQRDWLEREAAQRRIPSIDATLDPDAIYERIRA